MNRVTVKLAAVAFAVLCFATYVVFLEVQASEASEEQISSAAIWDPPAGELQQISKTCSPQASYTSCFIDQMPNFGASPDAVAFTRAYAEQNQGRVALLHGFRPVDSVDLGYAYFPGGADLNRGWLLLNGTPGIINVDDLGLLPEPEMMKDSAYAALRRHHPQIKVFSEDRPFQTMPPADSLPDGGQWFDIDYPLKDQCQPCVVVGHASFRFEFDPTGQLARVKFLKVTPVNP
jgi:hypothetical protein